jgi:hypothetical protein
VQVPEHHDVVALAWSMGLPRVVEGRRTVGVVRQVLVDIWHEAPSTWPWSSAHLAGHHSWPARVVPDHPHGQARSRRGGRS